MVLEMSRVISASRLRCRAAYDMTFICSENKCLWEKMPRIHPESEGNCLVWKLFAANIHWMCRMRVYAKQTAFLPVLKKTFFFLAYLPTSFGIPRSRLLPELCLFPENLCISHNHHAHRSRSTADSHIRGIARRWGLHFRLDVYGHHGSKTDTRIADMPIIIPPKSLWGRHIFVITLWASQFLKCRALPPYRFEGRG